MKAALLVAVLLLAAVFTVAVRDPVRAERIFASWVRE